jgi:hypothetical protein
MRTWKFIEQEKEEQEEMDEYRERLVRNLNQIHRSNSEMVPKYELQLRMAIFLVLIILLFVAEFFIIQGLV